MLQVFIVGNLGADPELRFTGGGKAVANLRVATTDFYDGEKRTEWSRIVVWDKQAENCGEYLRKGSKVAIVGTIRTQKWEDKDGVERYTPEIHANRVEFLDPAPEGAEKAKPENTQRNGKQNTQRNGKQNTQRKPDNKRRQANDGEEVPF